jgi:serine/threonine-protein kinase
MITETGLVKVMDFGIARVTGGEQLTTAGFMMGTPAYMAPEQVLGGDIDARADLYAMGVVLYRLVSAKLPFSATTPFAMAQSQVNTPPTPVRISREGLPAWVDGVVARALAKRPEDRFQTAEEFATTLQRGAVDVAPTDEETVFHLSSPGFATRPVPLAQDTPGQIPKPVPAPRFRFDWPPPARYAAMAGAALIVIIGAGGIFFMRHRSGSAQLPTPPAPSQQVTDAAPSPAGTASYAVPPAPPPVSVPPPSVSSAPVSTTNSPSPSVPPSRGPASVAAPASATVDLSKPGSGPTAPPVSKVTVNDPAAAAASAGAAANAAAGRVANPEPPANDPLLAFGNVKMLAISGQNGKEQDVVINLAAGHITVVPRKGGAALDVVPYRGIVKATYVHGNAPEWDSSAPSPPDKLELSGGFLGIGGRSRNWLTLQTKDAFLILRLDDENQRQLMAAIESRAGVSIDRRAPAEK